MVIEKVVCLLSAGWMLIIVNVMVVVVDKVTRGSLVPAIDPCVSRSLIALGDHFRRSEHHWGLPQSVTAPTAVLSRVSDQPAGTVWGTEQKASDHSRLQWGAVWFFDCKWWSCLNEKLSKCFTISYCLQRVLCANNDQDSASSQRTLIFSKALPFLRGRYQN